MASDKLNAKLQRQQDVFIHGGPSDQPTLQVFNPDTEFPEFTRREIQHYQNMFKHYDIDKNKFIDFVELKRMMEKLGSPQTHLALKEMIKEVDEDFDGRISFREFLLIFRKALKGELKNKSLVEIYKQMHVVDVETEGVKGATHFFTAKSPVSSSRRMSSPTQMSSTLKVVKIVEQKKDKSADPLTTKTVDDAGRSSFSSGSPLKTVAESLDDPLTAKTADDAGRSSFSSGSPLKTVDKPSQSPSTKPSTAAKTSEKNPDRRPADGSAGPSEKTIKDVRTATLTLSGEQLKQVEDVMKSVVSAHMNTTNLTSAAVASGLNLHEAISHGQDDKTCEISEMLKITGQPKPEMVWSTFVENMPATIKRIVAFVKLLPGFHELCKEDKICIYKHGSFEVILLRYCPLFTDKGMFLPDMTARVPRHLIPKMLLGDFFEEQYKFADVFNQLNLNDAEIGIVSAIMIMNDARPGLKNRDQVEKLQKLYLQSLYLCLKQNHPEDHDVLFGRVIDTLPLSDRLNRLHATTVGNVKKKNPEIHFPDVHNEIFQ